jgi:hypothetical protein
MHGPTNPKIVKGVFNIRRKHYSVQVIEENKWDQAGSRYLRNRFFFSKMFSEKLKRRDKFKFIVLKWRAIIIISTNKSVSNLGAKFMLL